MATVRAWWLPDGADYDDDDAWKPGKPGMTVSAADVKVMAAMWAELEAACEDMRRSTTATTHGYLRKVLQLDAAGNRPNDGDDPLPY